MFPPPIDAPPPNGQQLRCSQLHTYYGSAGEVLCYIKRVEIMGGKKAFFPLSYGHLDGQLGWHPRGLASPKPLYNLHKLAERPEAAVILCEGEKAANAAEMLLPSYVCLSWMGGKNGVDVADILPLLERPLVIVWPDNDPGGIAAGARLASRIAGALVLQVADVAKHGRLGIGGDAADLDVQDPETWLRAHLHTPAACGRKPGPISVRATARL